MKTLNQTMTLLFISTALVACGGGGGGGSDGSEPSSPVTDNSELVNHADKVTREGDTPADYLSSNTAESMNLTGQGVKVALFSRGIDVEADAFQGTSLNPESATYLYENDGVTLIKDTDLLEYSGYEVQHGTCAASVLITEKYGYATGVDLTLYKSVLDHSPSNFDKLKMLDILEQFDVTSDFTLMVTSAANSYYSESQLDSVRREVEEGTAIIWAFSNRGDDALTDDEIIRDSSILVGLVRATDPSQPIQNRRPPEGLESRYIVIADIDYENETELDDLGLKCEDGADREYGVSAQDSGTAAIVAASAALVKEAYPELSSKAVLQILLDTADSSFNGYREDKHGQGLLNLEGALNIDIEEYVSI